MELIISENRLYGSRYYTVQPKIEWIHIDNWGEFSSWFKIHAWCNDTYGPSPKDGVWTPNARWYVNDSKFWFREHKDLEWFLLKWQ